jgi:hypothetical protein
MIPTHQNALAAVLRAIDHLLAVHEVAMRERSVVTLTRRPGLLTVTEAEADAGARPVLLIAADVRQPRHFRARIDL